MQVTDANRVGQVEVVSAACEFTLDELSGIISDLKQAPALDEVVDWFNRVLLRQRDYEPYRLVAERSYARNLVVRSEYADWLVLCWRSGQRTPIHDHGGSIGVVMVCEGLMTETMFERAPEGHVRPYDTYRRGQGAITGADVPDIHQLLNLEPPGKEMVTLHCYAPPLSVLNTYSPRSSKVGHWREPYYSAGGGI